MPPGVCGDGDVNPGEECDDGNLEPLDGCSEACRLPRCGDGLVEGAEECDDGNLDDNDKCLNGCTIATCGDGEVLAGEEECDDANEDDDDGCVGDCALASCGDGFLRDGKEECDDGNDVNTDACPGTCINSFCGDGVSWKDMEECDDGNDDDTDFCVECKISLPFRRVFVTSKLYTGNMGGLAEADKQCQMLAESAGLQGTFLAWLGNKETWPADRMEQANVPYRRTDDKPVAMSWDDLVDGNLALPIDLTEKGMPAPLGMGPCGMGPVVHSNIDGDGMLFDVDGTCAGWQSDMGSTSAGQILSPVLNLWTIGCPIKCSDKAPIYCIQQ